MSEVYTYQELRELALKHGIRDNKVHIGVWLQTQGYQKQRIQINHIRKIFYLKSHDWDKNPNSTWHKYHPYRWNNRVHTFSSEATAYKEGDDRITVDIPGEYDADAVVEELGKPGALYFCTATTDKPTDEQIDNHEYVKVGDNYYKVWLSGNEVADAKGVASKNKDTGKTEYVVNLEFNSKGTTAFGEMTTQYVGQLSYIIYNDEILSAPKIQSAISGGQAEINGQKSLKEAEELASNIRIGDLKVELKEISHKVQSAKLGSDALSKSIKAGIIGFIIIILFLLIVYRIPGLAAGLALLTYVELMLLALNGFDLTLTLPGIAGIILNIRMADDTNVII